AAVPPVVAVVGVVRIRAITVGAQAFRFNAENLAVFVYLPVAAGGAPVRDLHRAPGSGIAVVVAPRAAHRTCEKRSPRLGGFQARIAAAQIDDAAVGNRDRTGVAPVAAHLVAVVQRGIVLIPAAA